MNLPFVSLTFDDAISEHLDHAIPILDEAGLKGTFYAHLSATHLRSRVDQWKDATARGHELGNHTIFHPATQSKDWVRPGNAIEAYSLDRMKLELETANDWLASFDHQATRSFAYPCSNTNVGDPGWAIRMIGRCGFQNTRLPAMATKYRLNFGSTLQSYQPVVENLFVAGRAGGLLMDDDVPEIAHWNRWALYSVAVESHSFDAIRGFIEKGIRNNSWPIIQFHGIAGGHHMDCSLQVFRDVVSWLSDSYRDQVKTVRDAATLIWSEPEKAKEA